MSQKPQWKKSSAELKTQIAKDKIRATRSPVVNKLEDTYEANPMMTMMVLVTLMVISMVFGYKFSKSFMVTMVGFAVAGYVMMTKKGMFAR